MRDKIARSVPIRSLAPPLSKVFIFISCSAAILVGYDEQLFSRGKGPFHRIIESYVEDVALGGGGSTWSVGG